MGDGEHFQERRHDNLTALIELSALKQSVRTLAESADKFDLWRERIEKRLIDMEIERAIGKTQLTLIAAGSAIAVTALGQLFIWYIQRG